MDDCTSERVNLCTLGQNQYTDAGTISSSIFHISIFERGSASAAMMASRVSGPGTCLPISLAPYLYRGDEQGVNGIELFEWV